MTQAAVLPCIFVVDLDSHQVGHDFAQPAIMIPFHPNHLDPAFGIRQLANVAQELPVFFLEASKIEVAEDIAKEDEPPKRHGAQRLQRCLGPAYVRSQVEVGQDHRVESRLLHPRVLQERC